MIFDRLPVNIFFINCPEKWNDSFNCTVQWEAFLELSLSETFVAVMK